MYVPYDEAIGVHPQSGGYTSHEVWDFEGTEPEPLRADPWKFFRWGPIGF
jgi:trehalose/maltose hydrolase-like predicted phosphorylase